MPRTKVEGDDPFIRAVCDLAERGLSVIRLRPNSKLPAGKWQSAQTTAATPQELRRAFAAGGNVAVATGLVSGLLVIDVDSPGAQRLMDDRGAVPTVITPRGRHYWYRYPEGRHVPNAVAVNGIKGLDVRGEGGYVLVPPSVIDGKAYEWQDGPWDRAQALEPPHLAENGNGRPSNRIALSRSTRDFLEEGAPEGERNDRLFSAACDLAGNALPLDNAMRRLLDAAGRSGLSEEEARTTIRSAYAKPRDPARPDVRDASSPASVPDLDAPDEDAEIIDSGLDEHRTDLGNARRLVIQHAESLCYSPGLGWYAWDGRRWALDTDGTAMRAAKATVRQMYVDAARAGTDEARATLAKWALSSESSRRIASMLELATSEPEFVRHADTFDADPWTFNMLNGTLDLRTATLRPHDRRDSITKLAPVEYVADVADETLDRFLAATTDGDEEFEHYLQRAAGYTLTGLTREEDVFLILGPGGTGKSTFIESMLSMLGDYGCKATFTTFLAPRGTSGDGDPPRPDLLAMRGARLVAAVEPEKGRRLNAALVKEASGGDRITARAPYGRFPVTFTPQFKLWFGANDAPKMDDGDSGLWRRLKRLPFEHVIPDDQQDPDVKAHLVSSTGRRALLAWAVRGCLDWQRHGLQPPTLVRQRTAELRIEFDPLAGFYADRCDFAPEHEVAATVLRKAYDDWASISGARALDDHDWGKRLVEHGCQRIRRRRNGTRETCWQGVRLQDEP